MSRAAPTSHQWTGRFAPLGVLVIAASSIAFGSPARGEETAFQKHVVSVERIWGRAGHSAFTDLVRFRGDLYCAFREGSGHIPGRNGVIRVIRSEDGMNWESVALLQERHVDLRDPKLSVTPDGRLMLNTGASYYHGSQRRRIESRVAFYDPEQSRFGPPQQVVLPESIVTALTGFGGSPGTTAGLGDVCNRCRTMPSGLCIWCAAGTESTTRPSQSSRWIIRRKRRCGSWTTARWWP